MVVPLSRKRWTVASTAVSAIRMAWTRRPARILVPRTLPASGTGADVGMGAGSGADVGTARPLLEAEEADGGGYGGGVGPLPEAEEGAVSLIANHSSHCRSGRSPIE